MDVEKMNANRTEDGNSLPIRITAYLDRTNRIDTRALVSIIGLSAQTWGEIFNGYCNKLSKQGPKGWVAEYFLQVHTADGWRDHDFFRFLVQKNHFEFQHDHVLEYNSVQAVIACS